MFFLLNINRYIYIYINYIYMKGFVYSAIAINLSVYIKIYILESIFIQYKYNISIYIMLRLCKYIYI